MPRGVIHFLNVRSRIFSEAGGFESFVYTIQNEETSIFDLPVLIYLDGSMQWLKKGRSYTRQSGGPMFIGPGGYQEW